MRERPAPAGDCTPTIASQTLPLMHLCAPGLLHSTRRPRQSQRTHDLALDRAYGERSLLG